MPGTGAQVFHHLNPDECGVLRLPRLRGIAEDAKLQRQAAAMGVDVRVHAPRISLEVRALLRRQSLYRFSRCQSQPQNSLLPVMLQKVSAKNLCQLTRCVPAYSIHLE